MKHIFYCFLIALIGWPIGACADGATREWLSKLDQSLANRNAYEQKRIDRIDALKKELSRIDKKNTERHYELLYGLYNEYKSYCYDSAHHYADECLAVAKLNNDHDKIAQASLPVFSPRPPRCSNPSIGANSAAGFSKIISSTTDNCGGPRPTM